MVVASVYAACKEMDIPRRLEDVSRAANADYVFAGTCFRTMARELNIYSSATKLMSKVAANADASQKTYRTALNMLDVVKNNPVSYDKDRKALATAALYCACV